MINHLNGLSLLYEDPLIGDLYNAWYKFPNLRWDDCFSKSQIQSKKWLIDCLIKNNITSKTCFVYGGWLGSLSYLLFKNQLCDKIRSFDLDLDSCKGADLFLDRYRTNWQYKSVCWDILDLDLGNCRYEVFKQIGTQKENLIPDLVINTICEHLDDNQLAKTIYPGITYVFQSNNAFWEPDHVNCKNSLDEFVDSLNLKNIVMADQLTLNKYTRYMVIGSN